MKETSNIEVLQRALDRERKARKEAERILESKSLELYELNTKLKIATDSSSQSEIPTVESKPRIQDQFSNLADAYVMIDLKGNIQKINTAGVKLFGYGQIKGKLNIWDLVFRDDISRATKAFEELSEKGSFRDFVGRLYNKDGPPRTIHANANLVFNEKDEPIGAEGILRDITEESKMKELLAQQQKQLSIIVNNAPFGIILSEGEIIKKTNPAFEKMVGYSAKELLSIDANQLLRPEDIEDVDKLRKDLDAGKKVLEFTQTLRKKNGKNSKGKINVTNVEDDVTKSNYRISIIEDITAESIKQELIDEQRKQLEIIVDNSPLGILLVEGQSIQKANTAFLNMLGYGHSEIVSKSLDSFTFKNDLYLEEDFNKQLTKGEIDQYNINKRFIRKNRSSLTAKTSVSAVRDTEGNIKYQVIVIEDISEQLKSEHQRELLLKKLEKSNTELGEYAHVVSHDLKSPLRSIDALVAWIKEDCEEKIDPKAKKNLDLITETVEKMEDLINGILIYSSIDRKEDEETMVSIEETIHTILSMTLIPPHIQLKVNDKLPILKGDPTRFRQLFQNLIANAIKYNDKENGLVEVGVKEEKKSWTISIKDNGPGIDPKYHSKIFGIFQSLSDQKSSTGIGLSIVKKIVELYGGTITLKSTPEIGTTFFVNFPK